MPGDFPRNSGGPADMDARHLFAERLSEELERVRHPLPERLHEPGDAEREKAPRAVEGDIVPCRLI